MKKLLAAVLVFTMPQGLWAQNKQTDWRELSRLRLGERIRVVDSSHKKHSGVFSSFSDQSVVLRGESGEETIPRENIVAISHSKRSYRLRNVVVSGFAGAGIGAAIGYAGSACNDSRSPSRGLGSVGGCLGPTRGAVAAAGAALGFLGGLVVGSAIPSHQTIYRVPR